MLAAFTKALTCLSKYGDELSIYAASDSLSLSATNSSKSAYCRFKYERLFFSKYGVLPSQTAQEEWADDFEQVMSVTGQLLTKSLLSILKHRTVEKTVERCEMSIVEGHEATDDATRPDDQDDLETRLIVQLHCKHGVVKTHRLILLTPTSLMAPGVPEALTESNLTIGPKALKDMIEHFPLARGAKSDPQLIWSFGEYDVELRSLESSIDTKGKAQVATELTISAEEFDVYNIYAPPTTIAFHLREFNATIAYADSMSLAIDLRFTNPAAPLFIDVEGDNSETLFVISTSQVHGAITGAPSQNYINSSARKRERAETPLDPKNRKTMKAVHRIEPRTPSEARAPGSTRPQPGSPGPSQRNSPHHTMPPPSFIPSHALPPQEAAQEPLFLPPPSSQLSAADEAILRSTGLGIESMDADELADLLEGEGEEVAFDFASQDPDYHKFLERPRSNGADAGPESFELEEDGAEISPTQNSGDSRMFKPYLKIDQLRFVHDIHEAVSQEACTVLYYIVSLLSLISELLMYKPVSRTMYHLGLH
ncbi:Rad9-domain-containing protein [Lyophyllum atratum]|nr:Rad9-domain-containing protein [Lyophyllum atratum]